MMNPLCTRWSSMVALFIGAVVWVCASASGETVELDAGSLRITLNDAGRVVGLVDAVGRRDLLPDGISAPLLVLRDGEHDASPTAMTYDKKRGRLTLRYAEGVAVVEANEKPTHLTLELVALTGAHPDRVLWGPFPTTIGKTIGETVGVLSDDQSAVGVQGLNIKTYAGAGGAEAGGMLHAYCRRRPNATGVIGTDAEVVGAKIALFGCRADEALATIGKIEVAEGLPHPMLDGVWAKISPEATRSYIILPFGEQSLDGCLDVARQAGLKTIYQGNPFKSWGHFELNPDLFPDGDLSMKRCVERAAKVGVGVGIHTLSNFIHPHDPYVSPVPDPRLARVGSSRLAEGVDAEATAIPVEDPAPFRKRQHLSTAIVGPELVQYDAVSESAPWRLTGCRRGAFGTRASAHASGADIGKLWDHPYQVFFPNLAMQDELAARLGVLLNTTGLRQMSFDGLEGCDVTGEGFYAEARFVKKAFDGWGHDVVNDSSQLKHFTWHMHTRMNWGEPWGNSMREGMPEYRFKKQDYYRRNLLPPMMGWFRILSASPSINATRLDEVEWALAKCAGFGAGCAWETSLHALNMLGNKGAILKAIRVWDEARHAGTFTELQRENLRDPKNEYHLDEAGDGAWRLTQIAFSPPLSCESGSGEASASWTLENPFGRQPLRWTLRVVADEDEKAEGVVRNIVFTVGDRKTSCPVQIRAGHYLVADGANEAVVYDANWNVVETVPLTAPAPVLAPGSQSVGFHGEFEGAVPPRVEVRFKMIGPSQRVGKRSKSE